MRMETNAQDESVREREREREEESVSKRKPTIEGRTTYEVIAKS